ncbi:ABC transporter ATP-binding protein [uncultured Leuconostoc sp.]|uniref:ABC transporter ATP-binding protein n=1 Tax=uncultured Leuconostoc sp. TaxID=173262 RepID=UPI0025DD36BF|nr:ABC transporter ATP-binding protein [uncultured Leuconostoc sp.]
MTDKPAIQFKHVQKNYEQNSIIPDLSFAIESGEFITILGSSGSGKTTTLKMINRLIKPTSGEILINNKQIETLNVIDLRRQMGYVVQEIGLFPHMSISENIAVVPKLLKWETPVITQRITELLELVGLPANKYATRYPSQLSGGQQQRIGVARALAGNPNFVLFDEPFGAIDALTRLKMQAEIKQIHGDLHTKTFLFVTHDVNEAFALGDRVMIMHNGQIEQFDRPLNIVKNPATSFVKDLMQTVQKQQSLWRHLSD